MKSAEAIVLTMEAKHSFLSEILRAQWLFFSVLRLYCHCSPLVGKKRLCSILYRAPFILLLYRHRLPFYELLMMGG